MENVPVSNLSIGSVLAKDVLTPLGSVLFYKGKTIHQREIEILTAFMVKSVYIKSDSTHDNHAQKHATDEPEKATVETSNFIIQYQKMFEIMRKMFHSHGAEIPVLELRNHLQSLVDHISEYNVLTFDPPHFKVEDYLYHNSIMVALTGYCLAKWHGLPGKDLIPIAMAGLLHDIGNVKIDPSLLSKPSKLSTEEMQEVKKHTVYGYQLLQNIHGINEGVKLTALQHHEKIDGSGYPLGIKGDKIHQYAKVISIADIFHAMTSKRYYKKAISPYLVLEQLFNESFGKLDPSMVQTFIQNVTRFHNGVIVRLSNDQIGEIVFTDPAHPTRPWVNVKGQIINLSISRDIYIEEVLHDYIN